MKGQSVLWKRFVSIESHVGFATDNFQLNIYFPRYFHFQILIIIPPCTECTDAGTAIDRVGDNTTEIKYRINQARKIINVLISVWWHKNIVKNRKLYIYQTIIQNILVYDAEVWQIPTREMNKILSTEIDVLRRSA